MKVLGLVFDMDVENMTATVEGMHFSNIIEAWANYISRVESEGRRRFSDKLESKGYSPHTGIYKKLPERCHGCGMGPYKRGTCTQYVRGGCSDYRVSDNSERNAME